MMTKKTAKNASSFHHNSLAKNQGCRGYRIHPQSGFNFSDLVVDNFAGGGGASTGIEAALGRPVDIAINHDPGAVSMHTVNHPHTRHFCESVWDVDPLEATAGRHVGLAWFSPDCTHFSKAKGGKPVKKQIRGLAWVVLRWAAKVRPSVIMLENVEEFSWWGPLTRKRNRDRHPRPCSFRKGETFLRWKKQLQGLGYQVEERELRACDYGAPTIRKRLFVVARCDGQPIVWPQPTHGPGTDKPYRAASEIIDWSLRCPSIFERAKPLADNTLRRIARGLKRFVVEHPNPFIVRIGHHGSGDAKQYRISEPLTTITSKNEHCLVAPFISTYYGSKGSEDVRGNHMDGQIGTQTTENRHAVVSAFLAKHYGGNYAGPGHDLRDQAATITARDHHALVATHMVRHFGQSVGSDMTAPVGTVMTAGKGKTGLVASSLVKLRGTCKDGQPVTEPLPTITAGGNHIAEVRAFLIKYYGTNIGHDCREPLQTVTSRHRFGIVMVDGHPHQITDIGMRMLEPKELYLAQGFPTNYIIDRDANGKPITKAEQVKRCGNSVPPPFAEALVRANVVEIGKVAAA